MAIGGMVLAGEKNTNLVEFHKKWCKNNFLSERAGKEEGEFKDFIIIRGLGQDKSVPDMPVQDQHKAEYAREWALYQSGQKQEAEGTPLKTWSVMDERLVKRLNSHGLYTIEAVRDVSDGAVYAMGDSDKTEIIQLRKRAAHFLDEEAPKAANANLLAQVDELRAKIENQSTELSQFRAQNLAGSTETEELRGQKEVLSMEVAQLRSQIEDLTAPAETARKPGRPKKDAT